MLPLRTCSPVLPSLKPLLTIHIFEYQITYFSVLLEHEHPNDRHYTESFLKPFTVAHDTCATNTYCVIPGKRFGSRFFFLHEHPQFCHEGVETQRPRQDANEHDFLPAQPSEHSASLLSYGLPPLHAQSA